MGEIGVLDALAREGAVGVSRRARLVILASDFLVLIAATLLGFVTRFDVTGMDQSLVGPIQIGGSIAPFLWLVVLVLVGSYEQRVVGLGLTEYGRVVASALWMVALISVVSFFAKLDTSRAYVLLVIPIGLAGLLLNRWLWRRWLLRSRRHGHRLQSTLVIGTPEDCNHIREGFNERMWAGYQVVATYEALSATTVTERSAWMDGLLERVWQSGASCIALSPSSGLNGSDIRELSWRIEGESIDLLISSTLGAVTGPRLTLRVATGLPFLHLDEVGLNLSQRVLKRLTDLGVGVLALIVASPLLLVIGLLILVTSGRPILFRQPRVGLRGRVFEMWKFRTMVPDADISRDELRLMTDMDSPIMKLIDDPRVTPVGRFLRRWSLDELPQLVNVLTGSMSLVGPRPHPLDDVSRYHEGDERRLLTKPGVTGLWQVAGRSDLSWEDSVELDLLYIENWSLLQDAAILARTVQAVVTRRGAY